MLFDGVTEISFSLNVHQMFPVVTYIDSYEKQSRIHSGSDMVTPLSSIAAVIYGCF